MAIRHASVKAPGEKIFAVADWNADHTGIPELQQDILNIFLILISTLNKGGIPGPNKLRIISQAAEPSASQLVDGEIVKWIDTDDNSEYLLTRQGSSIKGVEVN